MDARTTRTGLLAFAIVGGLFLLAGLTVLVAGRGNGQQPAPMGEPPPQPMAVNRRCGEPKAEASVPASVGSPEYDVQPSICAGEMPASSHAFLTASITNEAVDELGLKVGQEGYAIIKASDVMIGIDG